MWLLFSHQVMPHSLQPHEPQHARLPCPLPSPGVCSNSRPWNQWCHSAISSSVTPFSSCLQSFPASRSLPVSWFFASGGESIGASASASVLPMNFQSWFPLGLTCWSSSLFKGLSGVFSSTTTWKHQFFCTQPSLWSKSLICIWNLPLLVYSFMPVYNECSYRTSLVFQWLRLHAPNAGDMGSIPGQGTSRMPHGMAKTKCMQPCISHLSWDREQFCHPTNFLCSLPRSVLSPVLRQPLICSLHLWFSFLEWHKCGILQHEAFSLSPEPPGKTSM